MIKKPIIKELITKRFENRDRYDDTLFENQLVSNVKLEQIEFDGCHFKKVDISNSNLSKCYFIDVIFENCNINNNDFSNSSFIRCEFINCSLVGINANMGYFKDVLFKAVKADYSNYSGSTLDCTRFEDSKLVNSYFNESILKKIEFINVNLTSSEFNTNLKGVDFSKSIIDGISLTPNLIKGMIVNEYQAMSLISLFGIIVK